MSEHTKGPWLVQVSQEWPFDLSVRAGGKVIIEDNRIAYGSSQKTIEDVRAASGFDHDKREDVIAAVAEQEANFARLCDCVNACEGLDDPSAITDLIVSARALARCIDVDAETQAIEEICEAVKKLDGGAA